MGSPEEQCFQPETHDDALSYIDYSGVRRLVDALDGVIHPFRRRSAQADLSDVAMSETIDPRGVTHVELSESRGLNYLEHSMFRRIGRPSA